VNTMSAAKKERSTLAGEKRSADVAADDSGRQTTDCTQRMFEELALNEHKIEAISGSPATCNLQTCRPANLPSSTIPQSTLDLLFPTETEIYILPDGQVLFADLPAELAELAAQLGSVQPCAVELDSDPQSPTPFFPPIRNDNHGKPK
jgi:hypothetical protein